MTSEDQTKWDIFFSINLIFNRKTNDFVTRTGSALLSHFDRYYNTQTIN